MGKLKKKDLEKRIRELEDQVVDLKARLDEVEVIVGLEEQLIVVEETPSGDMN